MWISSGEVTLFFLYSILFGVLAGAFYDLFRILRIAFRTKGGTRLWRFGDDILCFAADMIYWLILAVAYSVFIYHQALGRLRLGSLVSCVIGFLCWHFTLGRLVVFLADRIIALVRAVLGFIFIPVIRLVRFTGKKTKALFLTAYNAAFHRFAVRRELSLASRGFGIDKIKRNKKTSGFSPERKDGQTNDKPYQSIRQNSDGRYHRSLRFHHRPPADTVQRAQRHP